jgi:hypothetical protein
MSEYASLLRNQVLYHGTSLDAAERIVGEGFREQFLDDEGELGGSGGNLGPGIYISANWRWSLWFGPVLLRVGLRPGTRVLDASQPPDSKVIRYLQREFGRQILTKSPWRAMPTNKQLTLPELVSLFRYHYHHYWEREYWDCKGSRRWPERKGFHFEVLENFRSLLIRYGYHGYGNPGDDNGIVIFSGDRVVLKHLVGEVPPSVYDKEWEDEFGSFASIEEVRQLYLLRGSERARKLEGQIAMLTGGSR